MDSRSGDKALEKSCVTPLSEHPDMDRLAEILQDLPPERQEAFMKWLDQEAPHIRVIPTKLERTDDGEVE